MRLGADLGPAGAPFDRVRVAAAVEAVLAAMEIVDDRYRDYRTLDVPTLIADDFFNAGCVLGPPVTRWRDLDLPTLTGVTRLNGAEVGRGEGRAVMGHPFEALAWLANLRARLGLGIRAGEFVLLGSVVETRWVSAGDEAVVAIEGLGEVSARFDALTVLRRSDAPRIARRRRGGARRSPRAWPGPSPARSSSA